MDSTDNKVSVKIFLSTRDRLEDVKVQSRRQHNVAVDYADLIKAYVDRALDGPEQIPAAKPGRHARWHAILDAILESGDRDQIQFVQQHLLMYERTANQQAASSAAKNKKAG